MRLGLREPEKDMGAQLARTMASPTVMDYVDLGGDEALAEAHVPRKWMGKSLADLHLYRKSGLTVLALERKESGGTIPSGDTVLHCSPRLWSSSTAAGRCAAFQRAMAAVSSASPPARFIWYS
jgi:Trk K+ transport system NAD-binding subunit